MRIDINAYSSNKEFAIHLYGTLDVKKPSDSISTISAATGVPCIVACFWIGEITEWTPDILDKIKMFIEFYRYDEILNKPISSPI